MASVSWTTITACLLYSLIQMSSCDLERRCGMDDRRRSPLGVCGTHLANLVAAVCNGIYQKRSQVTGPDLDPWAEEGHDMSPDEKIFVSKSRALSYLQHKRGVASGEPSSAGIVCECCTYKCSFGELAQYCMGSVGKRALNPGSGPMAWHNPTQEKQRTEQGKMDKKEKIAEVILFTMYPNDETAKV